MGAAWMDKHQQFLQDHQGSEPAFFYSYHDNL
jgi:hypothetical protein